MLQALSLSSLFLPVPLCTRIHTYIYTYTYTLYIYIEHWIKKLCSSIMKEMARGMRTSTDKKKSHG